jgi:DNA-binding PadR family transcriptional regulator
MSRITPNQWTILESLKDGPRWKRSYQTVKPLLDDLTEQALIEPCPPHLGRARNMVRLTTNGGALVGLEIAPVSLIDRFAESLAETGEVKAAAKAIGVTKEYGNALLQRIRRRLGPQAR